MTNYRFQIWKNCMCIDDCQRESTLLSRLNKLAKRSNPEQDVIFIYDTNTDLCTDIVEYIPTFKR